MDRTKRQLLQKGLELLEGLKEEPAHKMLYEWGTLPLAPSLVSVHQLPTTADDHYNPSSLGERRFWTAIKHSFGNQPWPDAPDEFPAPPIDVAYGFSPMRKRKTMDEEAMDIS